MQLDKCVAQLVFNLHILNLIAELPIIVYLAIRLKFKLNTSLTNEVMPLLLKVANWMPVYGVAISYVIAMKLLTINSHVTTTSRIKF